MAEDESALRGDSAARADNAVQADSIAVSLEVDAPEGCAARSSFEAGLRSRFERIRVVEATKSVWRLRVQLSATARGIRGELWLTDARGATELRAVDGLDCPHVVDALSLTAALAIEQTAAAEDPPPGSAALSEGSAVEPPPSDAPVAPAVAASLRSPSKAEEPAETLPAESDGAGGASRRALAASVGPFLTNLVSPGHFIGLRVGLSYDFRPGKLFGPELGLGMVYVPRDLLQPRGQLAVSYAGVHLAACPLRLTFGARVTWTACLLAERGLLKVFARQSDVSLLSQRWQTLLGGQLRAALSFGDRIAFDATGALLAPTVRRHYFTLLPYEDVGSSALPTYRVGLGGTVFF